jgi:predicted secreted Zn-dependent protease
VVQGEVKVSLPFGSVSAKTQEIGKQAVPPPQQRQEPKAWTRGNFSLRYRLVRDRDGVRPAKVRVSVKNQVYLPKNPSETLRYHERVHERINRMAAQRLEEEMSAFRCPPQQDLIQAEALFQKEFHERVRRITRLHEDWDNTHSVP